ncbi:MAG: DHHW family protein [Clostridiales bacterium]|nr:DHHW family protein [Clostridiales bacterium]
MKDRIVTAVFILLLACSAALFLMPRDEASFKSENRTGAKLPGISDIQSGEFPSKFESFVDDNISFRSHITELSSFLNSSRGIEPPDGKLVYTQKDIGTKTVKKASLLVLDRRVMEVFNKDEEAEDAYISCLNKIALSVPDNVKLYSMLIPTALEFTDPVYRNIQSSQKRTIDHIYEALNPKFTTVDAYSTLANHSDEYIYFGTDHHWTMLGSYYGYSAFIKAAGTAPVSLSGFKKNTVESFFGPLSAEVDPGDIDPDTIEWWDTEEVNDIETVMYGFSNGKPQEYHAPLLDKEKEDYSLFLSSDHPLALIKNNSILNDRTLVIIKDSYANDFVPWLVNNYRRVVMIDPRGFEGSIADIVKDYNADELLVMNYIFTPTFTDYSDLLEEIM